MSSIDEFIPLFRQVAIEVGELRQEVRQLREVVERLDQTTKDGFVKMNRSLRLMRDEMFEIKVEHRLLEERLEKLEDNLEEKQAA